MHHRVGITAYWRSKVRVILKSQTKVSDVVYWVFCLHHGSQSNHLNKVVFGFPFTVGHQFVQALCRGTLCSFRFHLIAELYDKLAQCFQFLWIRIVVYTVRQGFRLLAFLCLSYAFCHCAVGKEHEFLYKFVGILRAFEIAAYRFSLFVNIEVQFLAVELHGSVLESCCTEFLSQSVECDDLQRIFSLIRMLLVFCWYRFSSSVDNSIGFQ